MNGNERKGSQEGDSGQKPFYQQATHPPNATYTMDTTREERCAEIDAILQAVHECCTEQLTGVPTAVPNPIMDTQELLNAVQRVHELIQAITPEPGHANSSNM